MEKRFSADEPVAVGADAEGDRGVAAGGLAQVVRFFVQEGADDGGRVRRPRVGDSMERPCASLRAALRLASSTARSPL
jgi:hypothetical protein